jgi:hypothetical protein
MRSRTTCTVRALVEGTGSAPKQLRPMQTSSVWSRVVGTLCLASNGVLYAQKGERANFTSFPGALQATITLYAKRRVGCLEPCMHGTHGSWCLSSAVVQSPTTVRWFADPQAIPFPPANSDVLQRLRNDEFGLLMKQPGPTFDPTLMSSTV